MTVHWRAVLLNILTIGLCGGTLAIVSVWITGWPWMAFVTGAVNGAVWYALGVRAGDCVTWEPRR